MRRKPGAHLSREGIALAGLVAGDTRYDLVVTSDIPHAIETAIAMGLEVDQLRIGRLLSRSSKRFRSDAAEATHRRPIGAY
jgi:hypothetical protein